MSLKNLLETNTTTIETALNTLFDVKNSRLQQAMHYGSLNGGKRLRPFLVLEAAKLMGVSRETAMPCALALELIHCYSLIHDDLPAMDNDNLRRGKPTTHIHYDEATAILAGDGLLTLAFETIVSHQEQSPAIALKLVQALAKASGMAGMVGGQMLDLAAEGRFGAQNLTLDDIIHLQSLKTGALLHFGCVAGAIMGEASEQQYEALSDYGHHIGLAFQIADDILDHEGDAATVGKATGKDANLGKATLVSLLGMEKAKEKLQKTVQKAQKSLDIFGNQAETLIQLADYIAYRKK